MKIIKVEEAPDSMCSGDYHILTFAETGFAVLTGCADEFGLDREIVEQFSNRINQNDESVTASVEDGGRVRVTMK